MVVLVVNLLPMVNSKNIVNYFLPNKKHN
jgi:hypothetical protein